MFLCNWFVKIEDNKLLVHPFNAAFETGETVFFKCNLCWMGGCLIIHSVDCPSILFYLVFIKKGESKKGSVFDTQLFQSWGILWLNLQKCYTLFWKPQIQEFYHRIWIHQDWHSWVSKTAPFFDSPFSIASNSLWLLGGSYWADFRLMV